jgi:heme/copper-type cytochrome/quinol oxidase subunit 3
MIGSSYAALFYSYFYIRLFSDQWPQDELARPHLGWPSLGYGFLVVAGIAQAWSMRCFRRDEKARLGFAGGLLAGAIYAGLQGLDWLQTEFTPQTNAYGSLFYVISGVTVLLVVVGLVISAAGLLRIPKSDPQNRAHLTLHLEVATLYWTFIAVVGALVFATLYLSPYLL